MSALVIAGSIKRRAVLQPQTCREPRQADELLRRGWGGGTFPPSPSRMSSRSAGRHTQAKASLTKIDSDFLLPHPEPVWSWLQTLQLAISRIICSSSPACPAPHRSASSSHPHHALCPGILYGPPAALIIWTGGETFDLLNQRIPPHHRSVCEHVDERGRQWIHSNGWLQEFLLFFVLFFHTNLNNRFVVEIRPTEWKAIAHKYLLQAPLSAIYCIYFSISDFGPLAHACIASLLVFMSATDWDVTHILHFDGNWIKVEFIVMRLKENWIQLGTSLKKALSVIYQKCLLLIAMHYFKGRAGQWIDWEHW